jgi:proline dehydrogenase
MLRKPLLYLSNQRRVASFVRKNRLASRFAQRFVAGETLDDAMRAVRGANARHLTASLDLLGESVTNEAEARAAGRAYVEILDRIRAEHLDAHVSLKLTAMGLDISPELCAAIVRDVLARAREHGSFVRLDMEASAYTDRTLRLFEEQLYPEFPANVGIVLQSYLHRTEADVRRAIELQCRVRLCKGAYQEPPTVAYPAKRDVDENYVRCMRLLLEQGHYPAIATHDERMIAEAKRFVRERGIASDRFEFQMLYGVRRDLQEQLVGEGYRMRVYVPFGTQWYPSPSSPAISFGSRSAGGGDRMSGRFLPADHSKGDANTLGGYAAVHARPPAFEGSDGLSYSVEILSDATGDAARPFAAYLIFLRWRRMGAQGIEGHLESDFLSFGADEAEARARLGVMLLSDVREVLESLLARQARPSERRWWDAMRDESDE